MNWPSSFRCPLEAIAGYGVAAAGILPLRLKPFLPSARRVGRASDARKWFDQEGWGLQLEAPSTLVSVY